MAKLKDKKEDMVNVNMRKEPEAIKEPAAEKRKLLCGRYFTCYRRTFHMAWQSP